MTKAAVIKLADYKAKMGGSVSAQTHNEGMAEKVAKDSLEVEKKNLTSTEVLNSSMKSLIAAIKEQTKTQGGTSGVVGDKASGVKHYKGAGGAVKERMDDFKSLFTLRGFLDKTGIVKKGSTGFLGGIADAALEKREARQQFVKDRLNTDRNNTVKLYGEKKAAKIFEKQFDPANAKIGAIQQNQKEMAGLKERGFSDKKIAGTTFAENQAGLEADLAKSDSRFREGIAGNGKPRVEKAGGSNVFAIGSKKGDKDSGMAAGAGTSEDEVENARLMASQTELLSKIEENTRGAGGEGGEKKDEKAGIGGLMDKFLGGPKKFIAGIIDSLMGALTSFGGMLMSGLSSAFKFLFNPKTLLKVFTKVLAPLAIVGALVNGIMDGFNAFMETGSITEALIAGLGGFLDFLTFGLIDAKVLGEVADWVGGAIDEYLIQPISNFFEKIGSGIMSMFDGFKNFEIPSFSVLGKKFGPWYPFKSESSSASGGESGSTAKQVEPATDTKKLGAVESSGKLSSTAAGDTPKLADKVGSDSKAVEAGKNAPASNVTTVVNNTSNSSNQKSTTAISAPTPRNSENPINDYVRRRA